jgi:uncharacterized phage-associated protein
MVINKKYENAILYICSKLGGSLRGKKKLAKLLYYIDFDRYEFKESMKSITGDTYLAWKMGPVPKHFKDAIDTLVRKKAIAVSSSQDKAGYLPTEIYTVKIKPDMSVFDSEDKLILERVVKKYGELTGNQLESLTHSEAPFIATEQSSVIDYGLAFYRGTDFDDVVVGA